MDALYVWRDDFGEYEISPRIAAMFRKDGWFDGRRKGSAALKSYFAANQAERARLYMDGGDLSVWKAPPLPE